jgi:predicted PurR-regulated permease PerM
MGSKLAGVIGAMIAVPTAVLVSVLVQEYLVNNDETETVPEAAPVELVP